MLYLSNKGINSHTSFMHMPKNCSMELGAGKYDNKQGPLPCPLGAHSLVDQMDKQVGNNKK